MTRDEHERTALMGGSAFQETGMGDYLTRVAEAVRDACAAEAFMETTLAVEYVSATCPGEIISNMILNNIDLPAVIASVPRPEPVAWIIDWPEAPELGHYLAEEPSPAGRSRGLYAEPVAAQPAVPDGWPTEEMISAFAAEFSVYRQRETFGPAFRAALAAAPEAPQVAAARDVLAERQRQISAEGWTPEHDDAHAGGALIMAAVCYADWNLYAPELPNGGEDHTPFNWPWSASWWKPSTPRRNLVKAGALILAEIERLDRAASRDGSASE